MHRICATVALLSLTIVAGSSRLALGQDRFNLKDSGTRQRTEASLRAYGEERFQREQEAIDYAAEQAARAQRQANENMRFHQGRYTSPTAIRLEDGELPPQSKVTPAGPRASEHLDEGPFRDEGR